MGGELKRKGPPTRFLLGRARRIDVGEVNVLGSSYSPDGTMIVFGRRPATGGAADIFIRTVDGEKRLTRTRLYDSYPDWGPLPAP